MSIDIQQVRALREGDVVEYHRHDWPAGVYIRGPLHRGPGDWIGLGDTPIRFSDGQTNGWGFREHTTLTVVSRAPRPLYVNHDRPEPVPGDVVRDAKGVVRHCGPLDDEPGAFWSYDYEPGWRWTWTATPPEPLTLLVDGETGQVVP